MSDNVQKTRYLADTAQTLISLIPSSRADASMYDKMEFSSTTLALWKSMWTCLWTLGKQKSFKVRIGRPFTKRQMGNIIIHGCSLSIKHMNSLDSLLPDRKGNTASIYGGQVPCRWGALRSGLTYHKTKPGFKFLIQQASACSLLKLTRESKHNVTYLSVASKILYKEPHGHGAVCYLWVFNSYFLWSPAMSSAS